MNRTLVAVSLLAFFGQAGFGGQEAADPPPAPPEPGVTEPSPGPKSSQATRRPRRSRRHSREMVAIGNNIRIQKGEEYGEVVAIHGNAWIEGKVDGDVVVLLGKLQLGPEAVVDGDVTVVAGAFEADPSAQITGSPTVIGPNLFGFGRDLEHAVWWVRWPGQWFHHGLVHGRAFPLQFGWSWLAAGLALLLYLLVALLFPRTVQNTVGILEANPAQALGAGLLGFVASPALLLLLVITGIGVLVVPFVLLGLGVAFVFGKVAVYRYAGQRAGAALGWAALQKPLLALVLGAVGFYFLYAVPFLGLILWTFALALGFGAILLAIFRREPKATDGSQVQAVSATPPFLGAGEAPLAAAPAENVALLPRAGFWIRLLATLLDAVLVGLLIGPLLHLHEWFLLVWVAYHLTFWSWKGTTVGGIVVGLRIVRVDGRPINFAVALVRCLASFFSLVVLGLGFLWAGWSQDRQSWHDKIAGTIIVKHPKGTPLV